MAHLNLLLCLLLSCSFFHQIASCKKIVTTSMSSSQMPLLQGSRQEIPLMNSLTQVESNPTIRASSFMVDPLIIIALIALPTIGMLGVSSLIMPLIPIGIYLIQQFFPASAGRRRRSVVAAAEADQWEYRINVLADNFNRMLDQFNVHH